MLWAARKVGRPVKWTAQRSESFVSDAHGRDHVTHAELAVDARRARSWGCVSEPSRTWAPTSRPSRRRFPPTSTRRCWRACYRTPAIYAQVRRGLHQHGARRRLSRRGPAGGGVRAWSGSSTWRRASWGWIAWRSAASNFIEPSRSPTRRPVALQYDSGDYFATLEAALEKAGWSGFEQRRAEARSAGQAARHRPLHLRRGLRHRALGAWSGALGARAGLYESAMVRVHPTGTVTVFTGTHSHGQGHETTFAQIVAEQLGIPIEQVEVVHGDTAEVALRHGHVRLALAGGGRLGHRPGRRRRSSPRGGRSPPTCWRPARGTSSSRTASSPSPAPTARRPSARSRSPPTSRTTIRPAWSPGLEETAFYDPKNFTYPAGCHVCEVEIDPETGVTEVVGVHRRGRRGPGHQPDDRRGPGARRGGPGHRPGAPRGLPSTTTQSGQLLSGSYLGYTHAARAPICPPTRSATTVTAAPTTRSGAKGVGEVGSIGVAARGDQRRGGRAGAPRRAPRRHARHVRSASGAPSGRARPEREERDHAGIRIPPPQDAGRRRAAVKERADGQVPRRRPEPHPRDEAGAGRARPTSSRSRRCPSCAGSAWTGRARRSARGSPTPRWPSSARCRPRIPALADLAAHIGDPQVRNRGTLGGSLAHADPAADYPAAVLALGATVDTDRRTIAADDFFKGLFQTALRRTRSSRGALPHPGEGAPTRSSPTQPRGSPWSGVFVAGAPAACAWR